MRLGLIAGNGRFPFLVLDAAMNFAVNASLEGCLPLKFTDWLGGALAGRPIAIRYVDNRALGKTSSGTP